MSRMAWGIDIGSTSIKAVLMNSTGAGLCKVEDFGEVPVAKGDCPDTQKALVKEALAKLASNCRIGGVPVYATIDSSLILTRKFDLPPGTEDKLEALVQYEAKQQIPFPLDQVEWTYIWGKDEKRNVVAGTLFAARKTDIENIVSLLKAARLNVQGVVPSCTALCNFVQYEFGDDAPALILNAGHSGVEFVVLSEEVYVRHGSLGSEAVISAVSDKFMVSAEKAEYIVSRLGSNIPSADKILEASADKILEAIGPTIDKIGDDLGSTMRFYKSRLKIPPYPDIQKAYAFGRLFRIPYVADAAQRALGIGIPGTAKLLVVEGLQKIQLDYNINAEVWQEDFYALVPAIGAALQGALRKVPTRVKCVNVNLLPAKKGGAWGNHLPYVGIILAALFALLGIFLLANSWAQRATQRPLSPPVYAPPEAIRNDGKPIPMPKKDHLIPSTVIVKVEQGAVKVEKKEPLEDPLDLVVEFSASNKNEFLLLRDRKTGRRFMAILLPEK